MEIKAKQLKGGIPGFDGLTYKGDIKKIFEVNENYSVAYFKKTFYHIRNGENHAKAMNTLRLEKILNDMNSSLKIFFNETLIYKVMARQFCE